MTLVAKPVIDKQFWILQDGNQKVGNIEACAGGYQVKLHNQVAQFKTIRLAAQRVNIQFETAPTRVTNKNVANSVHGYPVQGKIHNPMWDIKLKIPIYTKTNKSKSWFAAGWYQIKKGRAWTVTHDPKMIVLQRYPYAGPFYTKEAACEHAPAKVC
jgi:hypothetical protein